MRIFDSRRVKRHKNLLSQTADEFLAEDERVYLGQIRLFGQETSPVTVSARGVYKARLFGACFLISAFMLRWPRREEDTFEIIQAMTGSAFLPFAEPDGDPVLDLADARSFGLQFALGTLRHIDDELSSGPSSWGASQSEDLDIPEYTRVLSLSPERSEAFCLHHESGPTEPSFSAGFDGLCEAWHESLAESIGTERYPEYGHERFDTICRSLVFSHLRYMIDLVGQIS